MKRMVAICMAAILVLGLAPATVLVVPAETAAPTENVSGRVCGEHGSCLSKARQSRAYGDGSSLRVLREYTDVLALMDALFDGAYRHESSADISVFGIPDTAETRAALDCLFESCMPELDGVYCDDVAATDGVITTFYFYYTSPLTESQTRYAQMAEVKDRLLHGIQGNDQLDDVEKALLIHDRLALHNTYDETYCRSTAYGALVFGTSVCQGYAEAYTYLLREVGIASSICVSHQLNHAWNIVYINDKPYHVDVTWDDPILYGLSDVGFVSHNNFLRSSEDFYANGHDAEDYDQTPTDTTYDDYFWSRTNSAFQLLNDELYYIGDSLRRYSDQQKLCDVSGFFSRLAADDQYLFYSTEEAIYRLDVSNKTSTKVFQPSLSSNEWIDGFAYEDGYFVCEINNGREIRQPYSSHRPQVTVSADNSTTTANRKVTLTMKDAAGVVAYYWGTDSSPSNSAYTSITSATSKTVTKTVSREGVYYLFAKNANGYISCVSTPFYKVSFHNDGVSEQTIVKAGDPVTSPALSQAGGGIAGWSVRPYAETVAKASSQSFAVHSDMALYAVRYDAGGELTVNSRYRAGITTPGERVRYTFTPSTTGEYVIYSAGGERYVVMEVYANGEELWIDDADQEDDNFYWRHTLQAGVNYVFEVHTYDYDEDYIQIVPVVFGRTYTVAYHANGGSGMPASQKKDYGLPLTLATTKPSRSGFTFLGWSTSPSATTAAYQPGDVYRAEADTTLYAVWKSNGPFTVYYNGNGGSSIPNPQQKIPGTPLILSSQVPRRSGYAFVGWATSSSAATAAYQPGGQFKNNTNTTLYAVWQKGAYRVAFHANGGTDAPSAQIKVPGTPLTLSSSIPKRSGYAFVGWATSSSATTVAYHPGSQFKNNSNTTLYAVWQKDAYRVTFAGNGGSGVPNAQIKVKGTPLTLSAQIPKRSGYAFVGWATSPSAATVAYHPGSQFKNNTPTTLYAVWQKDAYRVTFAGNGGSSVPNAQIKVIGTPLTLSAQVPMRSGYAFLGWSTNSSATTATYQPGGQFKNNATTTLYAVWKKGVYRVSFDANGGKGAPEAQIKVPGTPLTLSTKRPTRPGYKFLGWSTNKNAKAGTYASGSQFKNNTNTTLYAVWKLLPFTLEVGRSFDASITTGGQQVMYTFIPSATASYRIYSTGSMDTQVYMYDADGNELAFNDDGGEGANFSLEVVLFAGVTYKFGVQYYGSNQTGTIVFEVEKAGEVWNLSAGSSYTIDPDVDGDAKWGIFTPAESGTYRISSDSFVTTCDPCVTLYDANGRQLAYDDDGGEYPNFQLDYDMQAGETYLYVVRNIYPQEDGIISFVLEQV